MSKTIFSDQKLVNLYKYCEVERADDLTFVELYKDLSEWLLAVNENRDSITTCVIRSNKAQNFTLLNREEKKFTIIWDVSFWHYYTEFLWTFFSYDCQMDYGFTDDLTKRSFWENTASFFKRSILNYLSERFSKDKEVIEMLSKFKNECCGTVVVVHEGTKEIIDSIISISKEFVLMHELEHILYHLSPEIYNKDTKTFDEVLRYYCDELIDNIDENITHINAIEFKKIVNDVLINKDKTSYAELYGDFHAFFEVLLHHGENFQNTDCPFTSRVPNYLFAIKLLKIFESCVNYVTRIIDCLLSTKLQEKSYRIKRVEQISHAYKRTIFNRDYLSIELFAVSLMLFAEGFLLDQKKFAESIDTVPFVLPYSEIMQPQFNEFVQELANNMINAM